MNKYVNKVKYHKRQILDGFCNGIELPHSHQPEDVMTDSGPTTILNQDSLIGITETLCLTLPYLIAQWPIATRLLHPHKNYAFNISLYA